MRKHPLLQLAADNARASKPIRAETTGTEATVYLHGVIGGWWGDIDATEFAKALAEITADTIHLRINSPGGDVMDARAMMTALRQHKAKVVAHVDGMAASAATGICMACDEVEITNGAFFMIHNAWTVAIGNKTDMRGTADILDKIDAGLVGDYTARTGQTAEQVAAWMDAETWFTAAEAVEHGFADRTVEVAGKGAANTWDLSAYANAPKAAAAAANEPDTAARFAAMDRRLRLLSASSA